MTLCRCPVATEGCNWKVWKLLSSMATKGQCPSLHAEIAASAQFGFEKKSESHQQNIINIVSHLWCFDRWQHIIVTLRSLSCSHLLKQSQRPHSGAWESHFLQKIHGFQITTLFCHNICVKCEKQAIYLTDLTMTPLLLFSCRFCPTFSTAVPPHVVQAGQGHGPFRLLAATWRVES